MARNYRKWLAVGTGVGIEILETELWVSIARVRPGGIAVLGAATVTDYRTRPAAEWGRELNSFLKQVGTAHIAATVLVPRKDMIVRQVNLPGVSDEDVASALKLQIDSLHPFAEEDAVYAFTRIGKSPSVLVGITRREVLDKYSNLFAEAGIKVASFTFSGAVLYSAMRVLVEPPTGFITTHDGESEFEIYGESESRPMFSAGFPGPSDKAVALAISELRLPPDTEPVHIEHYLPKPQVFPPNHDPSGSGFGRRALPYATAVAGACPWLGLNANLLPLELRKTSSRLRLIPTMVLATVLVMTVGALAAYSNYEESKYLQTLQDEIRRVEPTARKVDAIDKQIAAIRARTAMIEEFRKRSKQDLDALNELTKLVPPPGFLSVLDVQRNQVILSGEVEGAAALLGTIDGSPLFEASEFTMAPTRVAGGEVFSIRSKREAPKK